MRRRVENKDPGLLTGGFLAAGRSLMSVLGRGFKPNLTNPSCTDVFPLPTRALTALFSK